MKILVLILFIGFYSCDFKDKDQKNPETQDMNVGRSRLSISNSGKMKDLQEIIKIIKIVRNKITVETDVIWTKYESPIELQQEIDKALKELEDGNLEKLELLNSHFYPTSTFQEISISNGWSEEYIELSTKFDKLYKSITSN